MTFAVGKVTMVLIRRSDSKIGGHHLILAASRQLHAYCFPEEGGEVIAARPLQRKSRRHELTQFRMALRPFIFSSTCQAILIDFAVKIADKWTLCYYNVRPKTLTGIEKVDV